jgi:hypothetical protein
MICLANNVRIIIPRKTHKGLKTWLFIYTPQLKTLGENQ